MPSELTEKYQRHMMGPKEGHNPKEMAMVDGEKMCLCINKRV
jgi:hypothetical protein